MRLRRILTAAAALAWLAGMSTTPLFESTEGRYGSIAAAMLRDGDFLEPRFNGLLHLTKPPLAYWAGAGGLALLPDGEFALRVPAMLAWLAAALLVHRLARALGLNERRARWSAWLAATAPLALVQGRMLSSDIFLALGVLIAYHAVLARPQGTRAALELGLGLALGFLAKGQMVLFWVWPPLIAWALLGRQPRRLRLLFHPLALLVLLALAGPWFAIELKRHPGLLDYWLRGEVAQRYLSTVHGRQEPWWYFPLVLPACILPWLPEAWRGLRRAASLSGAPRACVLWTLLPFLLLCFSASKRPNYLLPLVPPLALLAAAALDTERTRGLRLRTGLGVALVLAAPLVLALQPNLAPPTRRLVDAASGAPLVAYRVMPSALEFYRGEPVPVLGRAPTSPFDPEPRRTRWAPTDAEAALRTLDAGGAVLARSGDRARVEDLTGGALRVAAASGGLELLRRPQPSPAR